MTIIEGCRLIKKNKIQILHGHHLEYGGLQAIMLGKLLKRPIVLTIHGSGLDYYSGYQKLPSKLRFLKHSNLKIICQKRSAIKILKNWSFSESKIEYLKNFVDSKRFNPSKKVAHKKSKNIVFVGRLVRFKGPNLLLNAIPPIINQFPNAKFLFAGEGEMLDSLKQRSIELGVQNHVTFLGMVKNIEEVYSKADIFVSLSYHENFTDLALLEAMSFGIPVIATNVGETKRIIKHKLTGLLVSCDPKEIAEKINFLLKNPNISEKLGNNGRKIIIDQYSTEKFCKIHELIYRNMIKNFIKSNSN